MSRFCSYAIIGLIAVLFSACDSNESHQGAESPPETVVVSEALHNGIVLPKEWPPRYPEVVERTAMPVPYLESPPDVIPINAGRQLFVDDFLVESTSLTRVFHPAVESTSNPVLGPDRPWEFHETGAPYAAPFSDGVWYDDRESKFRMWYLAGGGNLSPDYKGFVTAYAESDDGESWIKPSLGFVDDTNIVNLSPRDSSVVWLDRAEAAPEKRYKWFNVEMNRLSADRFTWHFVLRYSADGLNWSEPVAQSGPIGDRSTVYYDPFRSKWVFSLRHARRTRQYLEHSDPEEGVSLSHRGVSSAYDKHIRYWFGAWPHDETHPDFPETEGAPQMYNHDAIGYESLLLGQFNVWQGPSNETAAQYGIQKRNQIMLGYSRDGFHWSRPDPKPFIGDNRTEGAWNWGNVQSVAGVPIIVDDELYFFASGRRKNDEFWDGYTSTGLFKLRRDGFASLRAGATEGTMTTRVLTFDGQYVFVNADVNGSLRIEVLDESGTSIPGYESLDFTGDTTKAIIEWRDSENLANLIGQKVRFRFTLMDGDLYSFWVSPWSTGESRGYLAGGGPGMHPSGWDRPHPD